MRTVHSILFYPYTRSSNESQSQRLRRTRIFAASLPTLKFKLRVDPKKVLRAMRIFSNITVNTNTYTRIRYIFKGVGKRIRLKMVAGRQKC